MAGYKTRLKSKIDKMTLNEDTILYEIAINLFATSASHAHKSISIEPLIDGSAGDAYYFKFHVEQKDIPATIDELFLVILILSETFND